MKLLRYFGLLFCIMISFKDFSQQNPSISFTHLTVKDGLCSPNVTKIYQDKTGYLWFCTWDGLQRYDGKNFKTFYNEPGNKNSLPQGEISDIKEDKFDRYWITIGEHGGLCVYDPADESFTRFNSSTDTLFTESNGFGEVEFTTNGNTALIASFYGLYKFDVATLKYKRFLTADGLLNNWTAPSLSIGRNLFLLWTPDGLQLYNAANDSFYTGTNAPILKKLLAFTKGAQVRGILKDGHGKIWFGYWNRPGFYCYDPVQDTIKEIILDLSDKKLNLDQTVVSIIEDESGNFYVGTYHAGIYYFNPHTNKTEHHYLNDPSDPSSIISSSVTVLFYDRQKTLWIGTDAGISKFNKVNNKFSYPVSFLQGKAGLRPSAILQSKDGHIWIGTWSEKGLFEFDKNFKLLYQYNFFEGTHNITENAIESINKTAKGDIIACRSNGFSIITPTTHSANDFINMKFDRGVTTAIEDERKRIWVGSWNSKLNCLDSTYKHITVFPTSGSTYIFSEKENKLLLDFRDKNYQFYCFDMIKGKIYHEPYYFFKHHDSAFVRQVEKVALDVKFYGDQIYAPTRHGLYILNKNTGATEHYTRANGLPSDHIFSIQKDAKGNIWLSTQQGLSVFNPVKKTFRNYNETDGLDNLEFEERALTQLDNGMMLACNTNSVVAFYPDSIIALPIPPAPVITDIYIGNKEVPVSANGKYNVSYKTNSIRIDYISPDFINSKKIKYAYKLEGFDKDWNYVDNTTTANYTNLDGGNYTFKVKAANEESEWNKTVTNLQFFVSAPYYKQEWFFILIAVIIIATGYSFYRNRIQRILEVERLRNNISRDLHDEIGSTLSSISMLSTSAEFSLQNKQTKPAEMLVQRISSSSQRILEVMDDIIWTINPKNDSLENMMSRIRELINDIADTKGIKFNMQIDPSLEKLNLPMKLKRNFYLIFKEAVANVGNHSQCKTADVSLEKKHQSIILIIKDDGAGFNVEKKFDGNGLKNMQQRAEEIKSILNIVSETGGGSVLTLTISIP